jgi:hypothetical protein
MTQTSTVALSKLQFAVIPTYIKKIKVTGHCVMEILDIVWKNGVLRAAEI